MTLPRVLCTRMTEDPSENMSSHGQTTRSTCSTENSVTGTFSALHLLRNCSFFSPISDFYRCESYPSSRDYNFGESDILVNSAGLTVESPSSPRLTSAAALSATFAIPTDFLQPPLLATLPPLMQSITVPQPIFHSTNAATAGAIMTRHLTTTRNNLPSAHRRPRSEKKPIPDEQKDEKYYERRKRNNQAAKKSRDARKIREDHIALRATMLEHENAILRTQIVTLREEAQSLRHMLIKLQRPCTLRTAERAVSTLMSPTIAISPTVLSSSTTLDR